MAVSSCRWGIGVWLSGRIMMRHQGRSFYRQYRQTLLVLLVLLCATWTIHAVPAWGYAEPNTLTGSGCTYCHPGAAYPDMDCDGCHGDADDATGPENGYEQNRFFGPHGGYMTTTSKCQNCHIVHKSPADSVLLLPAATITATCDTCHDGTGGWGVYGTISEHTDAEPGGGHSIDSTSVVPGGDASTGGSRTRTFSGTGGCLTCSDCHSVHGAKVVDPFLGDRRRIRYGHPSIRSTRLLRQQPTGASSATSVYGSDWCLGCHGGRASLAPLHNHPVDSGSSHPGPEDPPYYYEYVPIHGSDAETGATVMDSMGGVPSPIDVDPEDPAPTWHQWPVDPDPGGNRGYLMPYPRTDEQRGHYPICQQCHEDSRDVGVLVGDGSTADAAIATATADGLVETDNPRFQNFPHETENSYMLVEEDDDLCLNCHTMSQLR